MHVLITGGTGFIGSALVPKCLAQGHDVTVLTRGTTVAGPDPDKSRRINQLSALAKPVDAVINLAGASLAGKRWNDSYKAEIRESRLETTRALGEYFAAATDKPQVWLNASAIGFYGPRGDEPLDESAARGEGFSAQLCHDWEAAASAAVPQETRLCVLRLGVVLDRDGGAYAQMAQPFRFGIANWIGSGKQWLSWVHRDDVVAAMFHLIENTDLSGVFNLTAPEPVTSRGFAKAMRKVHTAPIELPMPAFAMRLMVGEMADELLLTGQRVVPSGLARSGFTFSYPELDSALRAIEA